jgi:hypothetical protein
MVTESPSNSSIKISKEQFEELSTAADFLSEALEIIGKHPESEVAYTVLKLPSTRLFEVVKRIGEASPKRA